MDEAILFKFGKLIDYGKSHPRSKNISPKMAWSWSCDRFGDEATLFKLRKCIDYGECLTRPIWVKNSPETGVVSVT